MANNSLLDIPGLGPYMGARQHVLGENAQRQQQAIGLMGLMARQEEMAQSREMAPLRRSLLEAQVGGALASQQNAATAQERDQQYRAAVSALGPDADQNALARVAAQFGSPDRVMDVQQRSIDRQSQQEATMAAARERITAGVEAARQRGADQRELAQMQIQGRADMARLAAGLRQPAQPRQLQLTADAQGNQLIVNPDGTTRPLTTQDGSGVRKPVAADRPMTEFQGKAALYGTRTAQSDKILRSLEGEISTSGLYAGQKAGVLGNLVMTSEQRRVDQAQRDFVNAVLRQESGAVISDPEFVNAKKQYFPQPGDDAATVAQKRANRQLAIQGFARMSGPKGTEEIKAIIDNPLLPGGGGAPTAAPSTRSGASVSNW